MYERIRQQISKIIDLSDEEFDYFLTLIEVRQFKRKELVLREDEICRYAYFVNSGCLRCFCIVDGEEYTDQFFFEGDWYTDVGSFESGTPSRQNIEALEKTEVILLSGPALEKLYKYLPAFERYCRLMIEDALICLKKRAEMLTTQNPENRYINLIRQRPVLIERIPQHYIASYLNIRPQSLSRIRKRILDKA